MVKQKFNGNRSGKVEVMSFIEGLYDTPVPAEPCDPHEENMKDLRELDAVMRDECFVYR